MILGYFYFNADMSFQICAKTKYYTKKWNENITAVGFLSFAL